MFLLFSFSVSAQGDNHRISLTENGIRRISLALKEADVSVSKGDRSVCSLSRMPRLFRAVSMENGALRIRNGFDPLSFFSDPFSKKKEDSLFFPLGGKKEIGITLAEKGGVDLFSFHIGKGNVFFSSLPANAEANIEIGEGNLVFSEIGDGASLILSLGRGIVSIGRLGDASVNVKLGRGRILFGERKESGGIFEAACGQVTQNGIPLGLRVKEEGKGRVFARVAVGDILFRFDAV